MLIRTVFLPIPRILAAILARTTGSQHRRLYFLSHLNTPAAESRGVQRRMRRPIPRDSKTLPSAVIERREMASFSVKRMESHFVLADPTLKRVV